MEREGHYNNIDLPFIFTAEYLMSRGDYDGAASAIERLMSLASEHKWVSRKSRHFSFELDWLGRVATTPPTGIARQYRKMADDWWLRRSHGMGRGDVSASRSFVTCGW